MFIMLPHITINHSASFRTLTHSGSLWLGRSTQQRLVQIVWTVHSDRVYHGFPRGRPGLSPLEPYQFYGMGEIDPRTKALSIKLKNQFGTVLWEKSLEHEV